MLRAMHAQSSVSRGQKIILIALCREVKKSCLELYIPMALYQEIEKLCLWLYIKRSKSDAQSHACP